MTGRPRQALGGVVTAWHCGPGGRDWPWCDPRYRGHKRRAIGRGQSRLVPLFRVKAPSRPMPAEAGA